MRKLPTAVLAKDLRKRMTAAELILWSRLRRKAIAGQHFSRQHPVGPYVLDFACLALRLAIELDGATHATDEEIAHDHRRDAFLRRCGFRILRFWNSEIYENLDGVLETIRSELPSQRQQP